jgi:hypothetical protein
MRAEQGGFGMTRTSEAAMEPTNGLLLIGRRERLSFPEWDLPRVRAKIDTGAYSSALGVRHYEFFERDHQPMVRLSIGVTRRSDRVRVVEAPVARTVTLRTSSGRREVRPLIEALVCLGPVTRRIRLTVADRSRMRCPMLLGREALAGYFLVDVRHKDLLQVPVPAS